jgi:uncharacterized protein YbaR (Trm112 family)
VKLDPVLLEILVCPDCKGPLAADYDNDELICTSCGLIYPVRDDIPVMLVDEARRPAKAQPAGGGETADELAGAGEPAPRTGDFEPEPGSDSPAGDDEPQPGADSRSAR